jgi:hypothetical protein
MSQSMLHHTVSDGSKWHFLLLPVLFVPTGTQGLNNFTIVEVSIEVNFFFYRDRDASPVLQPPTWGVPILVAFYDMRGLQWDYSFPRSPHGDKWHYSYLEFYYYCTGYSLEYWMFSMFMYFVNQLKCLTVSINIS